MIPMDNCAGIGPQTKQGNNYRDHNDEQALRKSLMKKHNGKDPPFPKERRRSYYRKKNVETSLKGKKYPLRTQTKQLLGVHRQQ
jgi:hypothetical protein